MWYQFPSTATLHLTCLELHGIVIIRKLSIVWTLIGTICIKVFNGRIRDTFTVFHSLLKEMAVCKYCSFNLNGSDDVRLAFLYSLCDVGHIALHLLVVLGTIGRIRIVRILKTVCLYLLLVSKYSLSVRYDILFIKQTLKKIMCRRSSWKHRRHEATFIVLKTEQSLSILYIQPMSDSMGREFAYLSSHATNHYFIPNWGILG